MIIFTWWDARGRRLPWLVALVLIFSGVYAAATSASSNPASAAAVSKARARYQQVTHRRALHWSWKCVRPAGHVTWNCRVRAWRGSRAMTFDIRVLHGVARIVGEGEVARKAGVVPLARVFLKSTRDAKDSCEAAEVWFRFKWRCEGWWGGDCVRRSLTRPNMVWCGKPRKPDGNPGHFQYFFMSSYAGRKHLDVWRSALYTAGPNGTSAIHLTRGTTKWKSRIIGDGGNG